ncbi:Phage capsid family protein [Mycobacterium marinum]|uniref:phage major capsid protein n=1 Tax=Mycobacterium marinum TaxID=1781 RepID=UPI000E28F989|nr:phage major capsid protein [Mycobacterium marinum]AXN44474.1 Phage capsid family protein [Mycobacterium marinum]RFZ12497.1 Phage capsid family protein [Mycobacterium marinum]
MRGFRFSFEVGRDGAGFVDQVRAPLVDAIHQFKATAHVNGTGTGQPTGFISALTGTSEVVVPGTVSDAVVAADPNALQSVRLPRSQGNSAFAANLTTINVLRQAETTNGALKFPNVQADPPMLCGNHIWEVSNMASVNAAVPPPWAVPVACRACRWHRAELAVAFPRG